MAHLDRRPARPYRHVLCVCGCGTETDSTFAPGHNRRAQGVLLAQLSTSTPLDLRLLHLYVDNLSCPPQAIGYDNTPGLCLAGCGTRTGATFSPGCGIRFGDALLAHHAGQPIVTPDDVTMDQIVAVWRDRQRTNLKAASRNRRHGLPVP